MDDRSPSQVRQDKYRLMAKAKAGPYGNMGYNPDQKAALQKSFDAQQALGERLPAAQPMIAATQRALSGGWTPAFDQTPRAPLPGLEAQPAPAGSSVAEAAAAARAAAPQEEPDPPGMPHSPQVGSNAMGDLRMHDWWTMPPPGQMPRPAQSFYPQLPPGSPPADVADQNSRRAYVSAAQGEPLPLDIPAEQAYPGSMGVMESLARMLLKRKGGG